MPTHLKIEEGVEPFLQACLKLLHNPQAVENLQALMHNCASQPNLIPGTKDVHKLYRYKKRTGREMGLTTQISDYEMDQVRSWIGCECITKADMATNGRA